MKIIQTDSTYRIYSDNLKTFDTLPVGVYRVNFAKMEGFFLEAFPNITLNEKTYGSHQEKVNKILDAFPKFDRNLGVIFSGDKGIGKSIAAKLLAQKSVERGYAVILVNDYLPGIADFLNQIEQEVVVIFDEFDKTYVSSHDRMDNGNDRQTELLTLLDGFGIGKKLYVITCNSLYRLNDFLVNRPGRFHYHIIFKYPTSTEIREYLQDKLEKQYWKEIDNVIAFAAHVDINYDCLRAIAFELNLGTPFSEAVQDLNIIQSSTTDDKYNIFITFTNGERTTIKRFYMDSMESEPCDVYGDDGNLNINFSFIPADDLSYDLQRGCSLCNLDNITDVRILKHCQNEIKDEEGNIVDTERYNKDITQEYKIKEIAFKRIIERKDFHYSV